MIKVSVIVPVYNTEQYLDRCLSSLVNQSLDYIEIIVVNDGSTDKSQLIIDKYVSEYFNRVKAFTKSNGGLSDARNYGLKKACGEYIGFVDSDDYVDIDMFKKLYDSAISKGAEIVECDYQSFYLENNKEYFLNSEYNTPKKYYDTIVNKNKSIIIDVTDMAWNKIFKKELFCNFNISFPKGLWHEDYATTPILISKSQRYLLIDYVGYYYLQRKNSITHTFSRKSLDVIECCIYTLQEMKRIGTYNDFKIQLYDKYTYLLWRVIRLITSMKKVDSKSISIRDIAKRMLEISKCFKENIIKEKNFYVRELSKAIISCNYFKFSAIIHFYINLQKIKYVFKNIIGVGASSDEKNIKKSYSD